MARSKSGKMFVGASLSYLTFAFSAISGLVYTPWMIAQIGESQYGLYTLAMSMIQLFMTDVGLKTAVMGLLSRYYAQRATAKVRSLLGVAYKLYLLIAVIVAIIAGIVFLNIDAIFIGLTAEEAQTFRIIFIVVAFYSVSTLPCSPFDAILNIKEEFTGLYLCDLIQKVATVALVVVALLLGGDVFALVFANASLGVISNVAKYILVRVKTDAKADFATWDKQLAKEVLGFSGWQAVSQVSENVFSGLTPSILAIVSNSIAVSYYGLASMIGGVLYSLGVVLRKVFMAEVGRVLESDNPRSRFQFLMERVGSLQLCVIGLVFVGFVSLGESFICLWNSPDGVPVLYPCIILLMVPSILRMVQDIGTTGLIVQGNNRPIAFVNVAMALISTLVLVVFAPTYGALAAGFAVFCGGVFRVIALQFVFRRNLGVDSLHFASRTFGRWVLPAAAIGGIFYAGSKFVPCDSWALLFAEAAILTVAYAAIMYFTVLLPEDRDRVKRQLGRLMGFERRSPSIGDGEMGEHIDGEASSR